MALIFGLSVCVLMIQPGAGFLLQNFTAGNSTSLSSSSGVDATSNYLINLLHEETRARQQFELSVLTRLSNIEQLHTAVNQELLTARYERQSMKDSIAQLNTTLSELQRSNCSAYSNGRFHSCGGSNLTAELNYLERSMSGLSMRLSTLEQYTNGLRTGEYGWNVTTSGSNVHNMTDHTVGFTVESPMPFGSNTTGPVTFRKVYYDSSNSTFDLGTGTFTCVVPGTYFFIATIVRSPGTREAYCHITVSGVRGPITIGEDDDHKGYPSGTTSLVQHLYPGDAVGLYCYYSNFIFTRSTFSGFLIGK